MAMVSFAIDARGQTVTVEKWGDRKEQRFDPRHPPADLPLLAQKEPALAAARPWVEWKAESSRGLWERKIRTLTIDAVADVTLTGHTDLQMPENASESLRSHEVGHDRVNAGEWDRSAFAVVTDALKGMKGMKFVGEGEDDAARRAAAWKKADAEYARRMTAAVAEINRRLDAAGERFDEVTDHGRSKTVSADRGVEIALKERGATTRSATPRSATPSR